MKNSLTGRCIVCGWDSNEGRFGDFAGFRIDCPTCKIEYLITWRVLRVFKEKTLSMKDGIILKNAAEQENNKGRKLTLDTASFRQYFRTEADTYEAGSRPNPGGPRRSDAVTAKYGLKDKDDGREEKFF